MRTWFTLMALLVFGLAQAQPADKRLQKKIEDLLNDFPGDVGVMVKSLRTGKTVSIHADTLFPTASMVKIPIMIGIVSKMKAGELEYHQEFIYNDSLLYPGVDILGSFKSGEKIELSKLLLLMLSTSDNTASLWLQSLAGTGTRINELLDSLGFIYTRVNSRTPGREANRSEFGWGQTTPREMVTIMERLYHHNLMGYEWDEKMIKLLGRNYWDEEALSQIPAGIFVASKNGAVDESRSETVLVMAPRNPYIFSIQTKNLKDTTWAANNPGWVLARKLSALLWKYYGE